MEQNMNAQDRRKVIDKVAAAVMLQSWLDGRKMMEDPIRD
jgi:RNase H-fold protein (predicted Holliday junction resolvase)